jgi:hypothetical protein
MALNKEVWVTDIRETLELGADFLKRMTDLSEFVQNGTIHLPQSGAATAIYKNVSSFPIAVAQRTDTDLTIAVDQYSTQAFNVSNIESFQLSYAKRDSVMGQHVRKLTEFIGDSVLQSILPTDTARIVTTSGTVKYSDIVKIAAIMDKDNVSKANRSLELPTDMYYELLQDENVLKQYISGFSGSTVASGQFVTLAGINIYQRPTVATVSGVLAGVAYQKDSVGAAVSNIDVFTDSGDGNGNPLYGGGTLMSACVWLGAGKLRADNKGIVALVQGAE